ncbi:MAG: hypothetical protein FD139_3546 [Methylocystaceae bacterium]|nr:MAG: hypothetical protein FD148_2023 [Methylocystaceae bacterium]KAF0206641.1 MAG: hypothetical protein FD172_3926 [Methylocystaceae bacterium]TXT42553.1 MAG: hypothetical protein FD139_3546 [Methylocystaceae bacterium]
MPANLAAFQRAFAKAMVSRGASEFDRSPGFAVYRNNATTSAIEALAGIYPTLRKILGDSGFSAMARDFFRSNPPQSPVLAEYGEGMVDYAGFDARCARFPYLADIAAIDRMQIESHLADDAPDEIGMHLGQVSDDEWVKVFAVLHPATRFRWFVTPAPSAWLALRGDTIPDAVLPWRAEGILLTRPDGAVEAMLIDQLEYLLLGGLARGESVATAAIAAAVASPGADIGPAFERLLGSGAMRCFEKKEKDQ